MLNYAILFFVLAIIAAVLGFSGIAGAMSNIAWILFVVFLVIAVISLIRGRGPTPNTRSRSQRSFTKWKMCQCCNSRRLWSR